MTIIVPKLPQASKDKPSEPNSRLGLSSTTISTKCAEDNNNSKAVVSHPVYKSSFKNISASLSLVISKKSANNDAGHMDCTQNSQSIPGFGSDVKVVTHGRRRSVDKQYRPSQPTGNNNGGGRTSSRRSGRSYQNYDNNSSNGNSGADGNGEDNDDSDDDGDDEYLDEDDDEEEEEEEEEEDDDDDKNDDEDDDDQQNNSVDNSIDEKVLATFGLKVRGESTVDLENAENVGNSPIPPGTPITLQGIVCHETIGGVLVVNIKWRNKIYCGSLMDCTRHSWARPRFQSTDGGNHPGKTRMGKSIGHGKGKGKGKRLRSNSVTSTNSNNHTVSPLKQKLRGRKKTISGSSVEKRQGFRSSKRKPKNDDDSDDSTRPGKRTCTVKGAPSPTPSPTLIPCPEPGCEKKYKHINGLRYHQAHAHLESKNQDEDNNSDDRSSTTPSPSEEFKEPDPLTAVKSRSSSITSRSLGESSTASSFSSLEKEPSNEDEKPIKKESDMSVDLKSDEKICDSKKETEQREDTAENSVEKSTDKEEEKEIQTTEQDNNIKEETKNDSEFVEVADKSTDTCTVTTASCTKHSFNLMTTVIPANEVPEVADTQEVWETVLDSGCVTTASDSETKKSSDVTQGKQDGSKGTKDEGQQVMITTCGINQLGIEVEDISENEEDIDPGQDIEFNSREEMEKAVENLQSGSFVASLSTENNLQMLSSLKDPSLIFGLSNRDRMIDEKEPGDDTEIEPVSESLETTTRKPENITESTKAVTAASNVLPCTISVETLVSRSITASKHEPPLTNADTPSSRFKYFPCRSYGDESLSVSNINNTNTTTLALIRDPELIKNDTNHIATTSVFNTNIDSSVESTKPSYTGSSGFNQDCTTSSIHSHGPKEELKEQSPVGDIIKSHTAVTSEHHSSGHSSSSYTSPKSSTTTTYNTKVYPSQLEMPNTNDTKSRRMNNLGNIEKENSNKQKDLGSSGEEKKTDETDKSSVMFSRQPSTLISKHNRPSIPSLPVGVAHPYQYSSMAAHSSGTTTSSHTVSQTDSNVPKCDEGESRVVSKEKPVGEVGPVSVKRPAIHAGLPTVIPVGAPGLKTQASLHVPIRQGLKFSGLEERASTPNSFRLASSPRSSTASPLPSSPRLSDSKSSKHSSNSPQSKPSNTDSDIVVVKQESDPTSSKVSRDTEREKKTSAYEIPKEHLTQAEQLQLYQYHQRQMLFAQQANIDPLARYAYLRSIGYEIPWQIPPEQHMKMMQQQQRLRAAEEERIEFQAAKRSKEESSNVKYDKRESHSPMTSTPPRLERVMKDLSPGEGSRSSTSTSESASRGMPCLDQPPEKKTKLELPKNDETDRELQKLRHKRQEEYLSKQSMQHKFTMLKQLENAGGAAKTHSIPPISDTKDDYQKTKYSSTESSHQAVDKARKTASDPEDSSQLELSSRSRDPSRDVHSKAKRMMSSERGSFIPSKYQEYLTHDQMLERYEHSQPGNSLLIPGHVDASYVSSRIRDRDSTSPYKSPSPRPSLTRSPSTSHRTSPYKIDRPSSSRSISPHRVPRPSFSDVHGYSSSSSRSSVFSRADKPKSPPHQTERHKAEVYSTNTSSSRSDDTPISRADSPKHGGYRDRLKEDAVRPGIISNNLAVRRGDVTSTMVIPGHGPPDEELLRRHSYMVYPQYRAMMERQQHMEQVYAMQNASRSEQYYGKRQ